MSPIMVHLFLNDSLNFQMIRLFSRDFFSMTHLVIWKWLNHITIHLCLNDLVVFTWFIQFHVIFYTWFTHLYLLVCYVNNFFNQMKVFLIIRSNTN